MASALTSTFVTRKAAIASSSLLALSAALAWSTDASAAGTCGAPNAQGVINCAQKHYAAGINYSGSDGVDDLTVNVGTFAGQTAPVTVHAILMSTYNFNSTAPTSETLNIGSNVSVSQAGYRARAALISAYTTGKDSAVTVSNYGALSATGENGKGIDAEAETDDTGRSASASSIAEINNAGTISGDYGVYSTARVSVFNVNNASSRGNASFYNSGTIDGIAVMFTQSGAEGADTGHAKGVFTGTNTGTITDVFAGSAQAGASGKNKATSIAISTLNNSGIVYQGISSHSYTYSKTTFYAPVGTASAKAFGIANNTGEIALTGGNERVIGVNSLASSQSYGTYSNSSAVAASYNSGSIKSGSGSVTGIRSAASAYAGARDITPPAASYAHGYALAKAVNSGTVALAAGTAISTDSFSKVFAQSNYSSAIAISDVENSGALTVSGGLPSSSSEGIYATATSKADSDYSSASVAVSKISNSGQISISGDSGSGIFSKTASTSYLSHKSAAQAGSYIYNSGQMTADISSGGTSKGIYASTSATSEISQSDSALAVLEIKNTGDISVSGGDAFGIDSRTYASAEYGYLSATAKATSYIYNAASIKTAGGSAAGQSGAAINDITSATESAFGSSITNSQSVAATIVVNNGYLSTSGAAAPGISIDNSAKGSYGDESVIGYVSLTNTSPIKTSGDYSPGIEVVAYATAYGSTGTYATAIAKLDNSGAITTPGVASAAIYARSGAVVDTNQIGATIYAHATTTISNSGVIATSGDGSAGIVGKSYASAGIHSAYGTPYIGNATATTVINNSGVIKTAGGEHDISGADGIYALASTKTYAFRYAYATSVVSVTNSGAITTSGADADGIAAVAESKAYGAKGCIPCRAAGYSIARSYATVANSGAIKTSGDDATGISVTTSGYAITKAGSTSYDESAVNNSGAITTAGAHSDGISAVSTGVGAFRYFSDANVDTIAAVNNSGDIATSGDYSAGISAVAYSKAAGLRLSAAYATTGIANSGAISTNGADASDISAQSKAYSTQGNSYVRATNYITNTGTLTSAGVNSGGILSSAIAYSTFPTGTYHSGVGEAYATSGVGNSGSITTSGSHADGIVSNAEALAVSYYYSHTAATATANNSGAIKTTGDYSSGIAAKAASENITRVGSNYFSQAVAVTTVQNGGTISVSGKDAAGISAFSYAAAFGGSTGTATATANVINTGSISASAQYADGVAAISVAQVKKAGTEGTATATAYVANAGSITAKNGTGISAQAFSYDQDGTPGVSGSGSATASVVVKNGGTIVAGEEGIFAEAAFDGGGGISTISTTATVENTGSITVTGDHGVGIGVLSGGLVAPGAATVVNAGTVTALGAEAAGVYVSAYTTTIINAAGGVIDASGAGGIGVRTVGPQSTVATYAGSTISGGTGVGAAGVYMHGVVNVIGNSGTITSANDAAIAMYAYAANVVKNTGTITGTVTMTTGAKGQNVLYNYGTWNAVGGNSSFTHGAGGGSNLVNEKGGTIVVVGSQTLEGLDTFTNLGLVTMTQAASANLGSRPAFETLTVSGDYDGIGGALAVDASTAGGMHGDELVIDGAASGTTKIMPTVLGTPGATTGNGILLVSAHSAAGASNFVLAGNAANGDEVAGAFEYNLAFDPGNGSSGKWYLQSQLYPGVYQFGQVQSAAALVSDQVNPSLDDLMSQAFSSTVASASLVDTSQQVASNDSTFVPAPNGAGLSGWGRFDEARFNVDPTGSPFADYKLRVDSMQIGLDGTWHNAGNLVMFGGYITPFHAWSDFASFGGHIGMSGTAYGLYGLWFSGPWQAGLRLNIDDATAHFTDTFIGTNASVKPYEKGVQAAVSYDMPLDWADFTPSAEFNYGTVNGVHFTDGGGDLVQVGSTDDVWGKLNGRFSWDVETAHNLMVQPYVNLGLLYRGDSSTRTAIGAFATPTNVNGWDGDLAVGVNTNLAANLSLSAQADYLAGDRVKGWTGFIGLRYTP